MLVCGEDYFCGNGQGFVSPPTGRLHTGTLSKNHEAQAVSGRILAMDGECLAARQSILAGALLATPIRLGINDRWQAMLPAILAQCDKAQQGIPLTHALADRSALMIAALQALASPWSLGQPMGVLVSGPLRTAVPLRTGQRSVNTTSLPVGHRFTSPLGILVKATLRLAGREQLAMYPVWVFRTGGGDGGGGGGTPDPHGTWIIAIRRMYMSVPDVELLRLPERIRIPATNLFIDHNADKKDWDFKADILGPNALDAVVPGEDGEPVTLEVSINGYAWQVLVEDWGSDLTARAISRTITGRSLSARLGEPFVLPIDYLSTELRTAQQLVAASLPYGWQLDWTAQDWLVTAGAWSATAKTPIQVAKAFADAIGAVIVPDRTTQKLTVQPRYPVMPWAYDSATPDISIPGSITTLVSMGYAIPPQANAVFIQGGLTGGVLAKVYREGTAGELLLQTVQDNLITHIDAARARGTRLLSGQWQQPVIRSFAMPVKYGAYPLVKVGDLLHVEIARVSASTRGIANSVAVSVSMQNKKLKVRQTVTIGERTPNLWANWSLNLPRYPLQPGTVEAINGDGTATVSLVGGGSIRVSGNAVLTASVGDSVFVQNGELRGPAPAFEDAAMIAV